MDLGVADHGFEDVRRALGIADQHQPGRTGLLRQGHDRVTDLPRVFLDAGQGIDLDDELVIVVLAQMRRRGAGRIEPLGKATVANAGHDGRHQPPLGRLQRYGSSRDGGFIVYRAQGFLAGTIVRQIRPVLFQDRTVDLPEAAARIGHARRALRLCTCPPPAVVVSSRRPRVRELRALPPAWAGGARYGGRCPGILRGLRGKPGRPRDQLSAPVTSFVASAGRCGRIGSHCRISTSAKVRGRVLRKRATRRPSVK